MWRRPWQARIASVGIWRLLAVAAPQLAALAVWLDRLPGEFGHLARESGEERVKRSRWASHLG